MKIISTKTDLYAILKNKETNALDFTTENDWLDLRQKGIGGSDVGAILGVNKYKSIIDVYFDKVENVRPDLSENQAIYWGTRLESVIKQTFEEKHKEEFEVFESPFSLSYGVLKGNLDGIVYNKKNNQYGVLEIKTANQFTIKDWSNGIVPQSYYAQVMHYLALTGFNYAVIAVLIGGSDYREFYIERNEEEIKYIINACNDFWNTYVVPKQIPAPDGSDSYSEYQKQLLSKYEKFENRISLDNDYNQKLIEIEEKKEKIKDLEQEIKLVEQELMNEIIENEADLAESDTFKVKLVVQNRTKVDPKFKKENADLINQYKEIEDKYRTSYQTKFLKITRTGE